MSEALAQIHVLIRSIVHNRQFFSKQSHAAHMVEENIRGGNLDPRDVDQGGFSRKMSGSRPWTIADVMALQAIIGSTRVSDAMSRLSRTDAENDAGMIAALKQIAESIEDVARAIPEMSPEDGAEVVNALIDINQTSSDALRAINSRKVVSLAEDMRRFCK